MADRQNLQSKIEEFKTGDKIRFITKDKSDSYNRKVARFFVIHKGIAIFKLGENGKDGVVKLNLTTQLINTSEIIDIQFYNQPEEKIEVAEVFGLDDEEEIDTIIEQKILNVWEKEFSEKEVLESIINNLLTLKKGNKINNYENVSRKAEFILKLVNNNTIVNDNNSKDTEYLFKNNNYKPQLEKLLNNEYKNDIIGLIVSDSKKIYTEEEKLLEQSLDVQDEDESVTIYEGVEFTDFDQELLATEDLMTKHHKLKRKTDINEADENGIVRSNNDTVLTRDDLDICLNNQDRNHIEIETDNSTRDINYISINRPYINSEKYIKSNYFIVDKIKDNFDVYRNCNPYNSCYSVDSNLDEIKENKSNQLNKRFVEEPINKIVDVLEDRYITDKIGKGISISVCNGYGGETEYSGSMSKKLHKKSDYNKSISQPPKTIDIVKGEKLNVIGIVIKSIHSYNPSFNQSFRLRNETNTHELLKKKNDIGYTLIDHIRENENNIKNPINNYEYILHQDITTVDFSTLDYTKNNFILFGGDKKLINDDKYKQYLDLIVPSIKKIFNIEHDNMINCKNLSDINSILSKYSLNFNDINKELSRKLEIYKILLNNRDKYIKDSKYQNLKHKESKYLKNKFLNLEKEICLLIVKIDAKFNSSFMPNSIDGYKKNIKDKIYKSIKRLVFSEFTINELENYLVNSKKIILKKSTSTKKEYGYDVIYTLISIIVEENLSEISYYKNSLFKNLLEKTLPNKKYNDTFEKIKEVYGIVINEKLKNGEMDLLNQISNSYDNGEVFLKLIQKLNLEFRLSIMITEEQKLIGTDFESLEQKNTNLKRQLEEIKNELNDQKRKNNFYVNKCENFKIVKVYGCKKDILFDNQKTNIYYDPEFDTSINDKKIIDDMIGNDVLTGYQDTSLGEKFREYLDRVSLLNSSSEIEKRHLNLMLLIKTETINLSRKIENGAYALLKNMGFRLELGEQIMYANESYKVISVNLDGTYNIKNEKNEILNLVKSKYIQNYNALIRNNSENDNPRFLYKRIEGIWTPLNKQDIIRGDNCLFQKNLLHNLINIDFDDLLSLTLSDLEELVKSDDEKDLEGAKCVNINIKSISEENKEKDEEKCIPKILLNYIYKCNKIYYNIQNINEIIEGKREITDILHKLKTEIKTNIRAIENIKNNKIKKLKNNIKNQEPYIPIIQSVIPKNLKNEFKKILNIIDSDLRLTKISEFIDKNGTFMKPILNKHEKDFYRMENDYNIYWNYPKSTEVLCCKHYLDLSKLAYLENETKSEMLKNIIQEWSYEEHTGRLIEGEKIMCRKCGVEIGFIDHSQHDGFGNNDRPIKLRETVSEVQEDEDIYLDRFEIHLLYILNLFTSTININLNKKDIEFIIKNTDSMMPTISLHDFYYNTDLTADSRKKYARKMPSIEKGEGLFMTTKYGRLDGITIENVKEYEIQVMSELKSKEKTSEKNIDLKNAKDFITYILELPKFSSKKKGTNVKSIQFSYENYYETTKLALILGFLIVVIKYSTPPYKIKGIGDERSSKSNLAFLGKYESNEDLINFLIGKPGKPGTPGIASKLHKSLYSSKHVKGLKWSRIMPLYNDKLLEIFLTKYFKPILKNIESLSKVKSILAKKEDYVLSKLGLIEHSIENEESWNEFRPPLVIDYEVSDKLYSTINAQTIINIYNRNKEHLIEQLKEPVPNNDIIVEIVSQLNKNRETVLNKIRVLSECLISRLNFNIKNTIDEKMKSVYINLFAYSSSCCEQNIQGNYLDKFITNDEMLNRILQDIDKLQTILNKQELNKGIEVLEKTTNRAEGGRGRTLLDYMYINESQFSSKDKYRIYLENQFKLFNYSSITEYFNEIVGHNMLGKKRIFIKIYDNDINLLDKISISKIRDDNIRNLSIKLIEIYPELKDDPRYLNKKILNILDYNGVLELDIISGQYKHDINNHLIRILKTKTIEDLQQDLKMLNNYSKNRNLLYSPDNAKVLEIKNLNNFKLEYNKDFLIINEISKKLHKLKLIDSIDSDESFISAYLEHKRNLTHEQRPIRISRKTDLINRGIFQKINSIFKIKTTDNIRSFCEYIESNVPNKNYNLHDFMENPSKFLEDSITKYLEKQKEEKDGIPSQLIIENYSVEKIEGQSQSDFDNEKIFREKELCDNKFKLKSLIMHISYSKYVLSNLALIINKYQNNSNFKSQFDSINGRSQSKSSKIEIKDRYNNKYNILPHWNYYNDRDIDSECVCPLSKSYLFLKENIEIFETIWNGKYAEYDTILDNLKQITVNETFHNNLNLINTNIYLYTDLLDTILSSTVRYDCNDKIKNIPLLDINTNLVLIKFIFSSVLNLLLQFGDVKELVNPLLTIVLKNIYQNEHYMNITDNEISKEINKYKARKNRARKSNHDRLSTELQAVKKLYRRLNIGDISNAHPEDILLQENLEDDYFGNNTTDNARQQNVESNSNLDRVGGDTELLDILMETEATDQEEDNFRGGIGEGILADGLEDREENM